MPKQEKQQRRPFSELQKQRAERLAAELRSNLKKRKSAARQAGSADATHGAADDDQKDPQT